MEERAHRILYDAVLMRPGCVLLQAACGGTVKGSKFEALFPADTWCIDLTKDMKLYRISEEELDMLSNMTQLKTAEARDR